MKAGMMTRIPALLLALVSLSTGCAPQLNEARVKRPWPQAPAAEAAKATKFSQSEEAAFDAALNVLEAEGIEIEKRDKANGLIETGWVMDKSGYGRYLYKADVRKDGAGSRISWKKYIPGFPLGAPPVRMMVSSEETQGLNEYWNFKVYERLNK